MNRRLLVALSACGVALCAIGGRLYRIDQVRCTSWPPLSIGLGYGPVYLLGLAALSAAWLLIDRDLQRDPAPRVAPLFALGALLHGLCLCALPFLSDDPLAYAAIGRAQFTYHQGASTPLQISLPPDDPFRVAISQYDRWLAMGSAYGPGFNRLCAFVARIGGDSLSAHLRGFQILGALSTLLTALLAGWAARDWTGPAPSADEAGPPAGAAQRRQARAVALVLLSPMALIEGTMNAHNDTLLALCTAGFALCLVRRRPALALVPLALAALVKASGLLLFVLYGAHLVLRPLAARLRPRLPTLRSTVLPLAGLGLLGALGTTLLVVLLPSARGLLGSTTHLLGSPTDAFPYCTRSIECLPRALLHIVLHLPTAAWIVGLVFRAAAGAFLLYMAARSRPGVAHLPTAGAFLLLYYLFFHSFFQPWYLLSLLPLLSFLSPRLFPVAVCFCISSLAHYLPDFAYNCDMRPAVVGITEVLQALMVLAPPIALLAHPAAPAASS